MLSRCVTVGKLFNWSFSVFYVYHEDIYASSCEIKCDKWYKILSIAPSTHSFNRYLLRILYVLGSLLSILHEKSPENWSYNCYQLRGQLQRTPVLLPGKSHRRRILIFSVGMKQIGRKGKLAGDAHQSLTVPWLIHSFDLFLSLAISVHVPSTLFLPNPACVSVSWHIPF